ncbi:PucR family transcriptional regulator [Patulibacter minatonensis]|uniref:PucR family transcriptional regulator n=1 Tax=Patulibacter minatonensis TaxID=298163 RepID=UPI00047ED591|nr:PucR family transcriptional regulator [Patulibacter minatonensis]
MPDDLNPLPDVDLSDLNLVTVVDRVATGARVQEVAAVLLPRVPEIAATVNAHATAAVPALVPYDDDVSRQTVAHSSADNIGVVISMLAYGLPASTIVPPAGALELFERMAEREDGLLHLLRAYRIGVSDLWQIWAAHVRDTVSDPVEAHEVLALSTAQLFTFMDRMSEQFTDRWADARRRHRQGLDVSPEELVRGVLLGQVGDREALARLSYDSERTHVAVVIPDLLPDGETERIVSRARLAVRALTISVSEAAGTVIWFGLSGTPDTRTLNALADSLGNVRGLGIGEPARGADGFRSTYREALDARRIAALRRSTGPTWYHDVALLSALCADPVRARALVRSELGPLLSDDEGRRRLRETLAAYLEAGESHVAASAELHVHQKTVAYRIKQVEDLLGRKIADRRTELEAALLVHRAIGVDA